MQQKEISRWLKAITIVLALMGAVFFLYIMPVLAMSWRDADESLAYLFMPGLLYGWGSVMRSCTSSGKYVCRSEKTIHSQKKMQNVFEISVTSHCCSQLCGLRELFFWQS